MATFESSGLTIAFDDVPATGPTRPMILVHGFTSNRQENWQRLGWYGALERKRIRTIALYLRGLCVCAIPHDPAAFVR